VVRLNRAAALAEASGPAAALAALDALDGLDDFHLWHAARAEQLRRLDRDADAAAAYQAALACVVSEPERSFLQRRLADVRPG
jgi:RNA polymerase sigma-70 factor (ECF subfamily)